MPTRQEIKQALGIPQSMSVRKTYNRAIRLCCPGGAELLWQLEQADFARQADPHNPHLAAKVNRLQQARTQMEEDLRSGRQPLIPLQHGIHAAKG